MNYPLPTFDLLESILWEPEEGYFLLEEHLIRLEQSAKYFGFGFEVDRIRQELCAVAKSLAESSKVRMTLAFDGTVDVSAVSISRKSCMAPVTLMLASEAIDTKAPMFQYKTTERTIYDRFLSAHPQAHDVILWNKAGDVTEGCWGNIAIEMNGEWFTPDIKCGLLSGVYREYLMSIGQIAERVIHVSELDNCDRIAWFNSVRKWENAILFNRK